MSERELRVILRDLVLSGVVLEKAMTAVCRVDDAEVLIRLWES